MLPQVGRTQFNIIASHIRRDKKRNEIGSFRINIQLESTICKHFPIHAKKTRTKTLNLDSSSRIKEVVFYMWSVWCATSYIRCCLCAATTNKFVGETNYCLRTGITYIVHMNVNSVAFNFITLNCTAHSAEAILFRLSTERQLDGWNRSHLYRCSIDTVLVFPSSAFVFTRFNWKVFASGLKTVTCALFLTKQTQKKEKEKNDYAIWMWTHMCIVQ